MTITNEQRVTLLIVLAITITILLWDWFLVKDGIPGNTISSALKSSSPCLPIPILFGIWMAHSFWYQDTVYYADGRVWRMVAFAAVAIGSYLWWEFSNDRVRLWLSSHPQWTFMIGYLAGHWVWPQYTKSIGG